MRAFCPYGDGAERITSPQGVCTYTHLVPIKIRIMGEASEEVKTPYIALPMSFASFSCFQYCFFLNKPFANYLAIRFNLMPVYTPRFLLAGYVGPIQRSTAVAIAIQNAFECMRVLCSNCIRGSFWHSTVRVPHRTVKALQLTVASRRNLDV